MGGNKQIWSLISDVFQKNVFFLNKIENWKKILSFVYIFTIFVRKVEHFRPKLNSHLLKIMQIMKKFSDFFTFSYFSFLPLPLFYHFFNYFMTKISTIENQCFSSITRETSLHVFRFSSSPSPTPFFRFRRKAKCAICTSSWVPLAPIISLVVCLIISIAKLIIHSGARTTEICLFMWMFEKLAEGHVAIAHPARFSNGIWELEFQLVGI